MRPHHTKVPTHTDQGSSTAELACGLLSVVALLMVLLTAAVATNQYRQCHAAADHAARSVSRGEPLDVVQGRIRRDINPSARVTITRTAGVVTATVTATAGWVWFGDRGLLPLHASAHYVDEATPSPASAPGAP